MKKYYIGKGIKIGIFFFGMMALASLAVMVLWNWLMPGLIGAASITWLQALGLLALSRLLFGNWGGKRGRGHRGRGMRHGNWKQRWKERYERMSDEEKEAFKQRFKGRCGKSSDWPWKEGAKETVEEANYQPKGDPFQPEGPSETEGDSSQAS